MVNGLSFNEIFSDTNTNVAILFIICLFVWRMWNSGPAIGETWILWQQTKAAEKVSDWTRLRDEIRRLSEAEQQCRSDYAFLHTQHMELHKQYSELHSRITHLEAYYAGQGRASQEAAGIVAIERMKDREGKDKK